MWNYPYDITFLPIIFTQIHITFIFLFATPEENSQTKIGRNILCLGSMCVQFFYAVNKQHKSQDSRFDKMIISNCYHPKIFKILSKINKVILYKFKVIPHRKYRFQFNYILEFSTCQKEIILSHFNRNTTTWNSSGEQGRNGSFSGLPRVVQPFPVLPLSSLSSYIILLSSALVAPFLPITKY